MHARGFTVIELVVTLIVVAILAASVAPRFVVLGAFDAAGYADQTASLIRYAQKSAIAQRRWVAVDFETNPAAPTLCAQAYAPPALPACAAGCAAGVLIASPGGGTRAPAASTAFSAGSTTLLCFDAVGRPYTGAPSAPLAGPAPLGVADNGAIVRTIIVHETGYVQ